VHVEPASQYEPTPEQLRHVRPSESIAGGTTSPHATIVVRPQLGQHASSRHSAPASQRVPRPTHSSPPTHVSGMPAPHATSDDATQRSLHSQVPSTQA
jgi:hypothetical protein